MIKGIGIDLIELDRIARIFEEQGERFLRRVFTGTEREYFARWKDPIPRIAGRFAAKEAVMKALGTGWSEGVTWRDIEVVRRPGGAPDVRLDGRCSEIFESLGAEKIHCTITHSRTAAMAVVLTRRRTVVAEVPTCTERRAPIRIGPTVTLWLIALERLYAMWAESRSGITSRLAGPCSFELGNTFLR